MSTVRFFAALCVLAVLASTAHGAQTVGTLKQYTFELVTLNLSDRMRKGPSAGARIQIDIPSAMTEDDLEALRNTLDQLGAVPPDSDGYRELSLSNGSRVRIGGFIEDPEVAGAGVRSLPVEFSVKDVFSSEEAALVLRIATAANLFVSSLDDTTLVATTYPVADRPFRKQYPRATFTPDAAALAAWVQKNIRSHDAPE